jgi:hypothetical protein
MFDHFAGAGIEGREARNIDGVPARMTAEVGAFLFSRYVDNGSTRMTAFFMPAPFSLLVVRCPATAPALR